MMHECSPSESLASTAFMHYNNPSSIYQHCRVSMMHECSTGKCITMTTKEHSGLKSINSLIGSQSVGVLTVQKLMYKATQKNYMVSHHHTHQRNQVLRNMPFFLLIFHEKHDKNGEILAYLVSK